MSCAVTTALADAASATVACVGTQATIAVCGSVTPTSPGVIGSTVVFNDCIYLGFPPCTPVTVTSPTYTTPGEQITYGCGGDIGQSLCAEPNPVNVPPVTVP